MIRPVPEKYREFYEDWLKHEKLLKDAQSELRYEFYKAEEAKKDESIAFKKAQVELLIGKSSEDPTLDVLRSERMKKEAQDKFDAFKTEWDIANEFWKPGEEYLKSVWLLNDKAESKHRDAEALYLAPKEYKGYHKPSIVQKYNIQFFTVPYKQYVEACYNKAIALCKSAEASYKHRDKNLEKAYNACYGEPHTPGVMETVNKLLGYETFA
ncbi:MAG: hypothetical protein FWF23_03190 [Alphaproteobacteria bacterium]|nr:hypothetical protein [Alphaproteobacteria bacterium]MCL2505705.1 hypothetical protein [Alphaproteobacteria bacterium]